MVTQSRDFVFVGDVVQATLAAMRVGPAGLGGAMNVASGRTATLLELLQTLSALVGRSLTPTFQPARAGDIRDSSAAIEKAARLLGYQPTFDLKTGLRALLKHAQVVI